MDQVITQSFSHRFVRATKEYCCDSCGQQIKKKTRYVTGATNNNGVTTLQKIKFCAKCFFSPGAIH